MNRADLIMRAVMAVISELFPLQTHAGAAHILDVYTESARRLPRFLHAAVCREFSKLSGGAA